MTLGEISKCLVPNYPVRKLITGGWLSWIPMAETEERELCSSLDVEARKELSTYTSASNPRAMCMNCV